MSQNVMHNKMFVALVALMAAVDAGSLGCVGGAEGEVGQGQGGDGQGGDGQGGQGQGGDGQGGQGQGGDGQGGQGQSTGGATSCAPLQTEPCYTGPAGTQGMGICKAGSRMCDFSGAGFGPCVGEVLPATETCNTPEDDDCDGIANEEGFGCVCLPGTTKPCYTGPAGTQGVGICKAGTTTCIPEGTAWGECTGEVLPAEEVCNIPPAQFIDEDCDGATNEGVCKVIAIAAGKLHSLALLEDTTLRSWGGNQYGELGIGNNVDQNGPRTVQGLTGVKAISASSTGNFSMALHSDGTVWTWGQNLYGQLGNGTFGAGTHSPVPVQVKNLDKVIAIKAGGGFALAVRNDGTVWSWGNNNYGQVGNGTQFKATTPVQVTGLTGVVAIAAGLDHSLALRNDGTLRAWGRNDLGQLGDGTASVKLSPVPVPGLTGVKAIAAGELHSLALRNDGKVWAWGRNDKGQLGDDSTTNRLTPVQSLFTGQGIAIAAGASHTAALDSGTFVYAWGHGAWGQLGNGSTNNLLLPFAMSASVWTTEIAAGGGHTLTLRDDGAVHACGQNTKGQLGDGTLIDRVVSVKVLP
jgi:alpha-tubulin suppressor-like RCC1 family protein